MTMTPQTAELVNKALAALAIAVFLAAAATVLPSFGPSANANAFPAAKADKLKVATADPACTEQNWPNLKTSCLRRTESNTAVKQVRLISADKL